MDRSFFIESEGVEWELKDLEASGDFQLGPTDLPSSMEYKLVRE